MPVADREDYIKAVLCLASKAPKAPTTTVPGARNRYDDFVATHIVNTPTIHGTVSFLILETSAKISSLLTWPGQLPQLAPLLRVGI